MNPVNWFEIPAADIDRAKTFYEALLGQELRRQDVGDFSMVYLSVDDVALALGRARTAGGKVITEKMSIGEYGFVGHFEDSEGNRVGLHSMA